MKNSHAKQIKTSLKQAYNSIADQFSQTRQQPWGEFEGFLPYLKKGDHVLDVGCGNGRLYEFLKEKLGFINYTGVDQSKGLLDLAKRQYAKTVFLEQDMEHLEFKAQTFDALLCIAAFHHLPTPESRQKALQKMHHALKKEGVLILTVWNLFQRKYLPEFLRSFGSWLLNFGQKGGWNDLWIKWGKMPQKRYYHAFLPKELRQYFLKSDWKVEEFYFTRKGERVGFWTAFNLVIVVRKI